MGKKIWDVLKVILIVGFFIVALGLAGKSDYEFEQRPQVCREWQGQTVCYQP